MEPSSSMAMETSSPRRNKEGIKEDTTVLNRKGKGSISRRLLAIRSRGMISACLRFPSGTSSKSNQTSVLSPRMQVTACTSTSITTEP